jgi:group II intron reverse transcriptase/maturase
LRKEKQAVDTDYQGDRLWLLDIQRKLYTWSKSHPDEAWRDMWNWVTDPHNLRIAWRRVTCNRGARSAGVDKVTVRQIIRRGGVDHFLTNLRERLRCGSYRPSPVRRVMIPKRGQPLRFRPLGVPTVEDRVVQAAILQLLEPIFEADFYPQSYGFRPKRSCRDALEHIRIAIRPRKANRSKGYAPYQWVIEGDIKGCFDNINHHYLLTRLRKRVGDVKVCRVVRAFLKAGALVEEAFWRTDSGTPQGGILSPLLANIVLSAIEERYRRYVRPGVRRDGKPYAFPDKVPNRFRDEERKKGRPVFMPVRYADDFVVLVSGTEEDARAEKEALSRFLHDELKLTLSPEKTHVTALTEGFTFLGHRVRLRWDDRWGLWPRIEIPKEKILDLRYRVKQMTNRGQIFCSLQKVIDALNPVLLGWGRFYQHCYGAKDVFSHVDSYAWERIFRWLRKKYPRASRGELYRRFWRKLDGRQNYCWMDRRPISLVADLKVRRHNLGRVAWPAYTL